MDPLQQLLAERRAAIAANDPVAGLCWAASIEDGAAQVRTLVLRELDGQLALFINASSGKWQAWQQQPVAIAIYLPTQNLQYRLRCETSEIDPDAVHRSWLQRPAVPKQLDWLYERRPQSSPIESRQTLIEELAAIGAPQQAPQSARGIALRPSEIERLDLGTDSGVHDRRRYTRSGEGWEMTVLVP